MLESQKPRPRSWIWSDSVKRWGKSVIPCVKLGLFSVGNEEFSGFPLWWLNCLVISSPLLHVFSWSSPWVNLSAMPGVIKVSSRERSLVERLRGGALIFGASKVDVAFSKLLQEYKRLLLRFSISEICCQVNDVSLLYIYIYIYIIASISIP